MKITKQLIFGISFLMLFACGGQGENDSQISTENWNTYSDDKVEIKYPEDWSEDASGQMGTSLMLFSPLESDNDAFRDNVNIVIQNLQGQGYGLDEYISLSIDQIKLLITDAEIESSERLNGVNGEYHKLVYFGKQGQFELRFEQLFWIIDEEVFIITFGCEDDKYNMYDEISEGIFNSFRIK